METEPTKHGEQSTADINRYLPQLRMLAVTDGYCTELPTGLIDDNSNIRTNVDLDDGFVESIRKHGILHPIVVTVVNGEKPVVRCIAGHRRLSAAKRLGIPLVKCISKTLDSAGTLTAAISENLNRTPLHPLDLAESFRSLADQGIAIVQLEEMFGRDRKTIARFIKMAAWTSRAKKMIREHPKRFSVRLLLSLASRRMTPEEAEKQIEEIAKGGGLAKRAKPLTGEPLKKALDDFYATHTVSESERNLIHEALRHLRVLPPE